MHSNQYEIIAKYIRLQIGYFASSHSLPINLVLFCLHSNDSDLLSTLRSKVTELKQFLTSLENLEDINLPPLCLKEFKKHSIDTNVLREGILKFREEDLLWYGKLNLSQAILGLCYKKIAEDGGLYNQNYTEISLLKEAHLKKLEDGSIKIEWNKKERGAYVRVYAIKKCALEKELITLGNNCNIKMLPFEGDYHKGCIVPVESVKILKKNGLFNFNNSDEASRCLEGYKLYSTLEEENRKSFTGSTHRAINVIVSDQINKIGRPLLKKHLENQMHLQNQIRDCLRIRLSRYKDLLGLGPISYIFAWQQQDLMIEVKNETTKDELLSFLASLLEMNYETLSKNQNDLPTNILSLPLSSINKLFRLSINDIINVPELKIIAQRYTCFGEDVLDIDKALKKQADDILAPGVTNFFSPPAKDKESSITVEQLNHLFQLEPGIIIDCKNGLCKSIEIITPDFKTAEQLEQIVRKKMEQGKKKYGGIIRAGGVLKKESFLEVSFRALEDLKGLLNQVPQATLSPQQPY